MNSFEQSFWNGSRATRACEDCSMSMTELFSSWVCDRCNPPKAPGATTCEGGACPVAVPEASRTWYTYSTRSGLNEVADGYKLFDDFSTIRNRCTVKAAVKGPYYIYEVDKSENTFVDASRTQPLSSRTVKVRQIDTIS